MYQISLTDGLNFKLVKFEERLQARCVDLSGEPNMYMLDEDGNAQLTNDYIPIENENFNPNYGVVYVGVDNAEQCTVSGGTWLPEDEDYPHCYDEEGEEIPCPPEDYMRGAIQDIPGAVLETTNAGGKSMYSYGSYAHINGLKFEVMELSAQEVKVNSLAKVPAGSVLELEGLTDANGEWLFNAEQVPD